MPAPIQPRQPIQAGAAQAEYIPNQPTAGELGLAAHVRTPFVSSHLLNAQMERRMALAENNAMAEQAAAEQTRQFNEGAALEKLKAYLGTLNTPYGGEGARTVGELDPGTGWDTGRIEGIEQQAKDKAAADAYQQYASGAGTLAQVGAEMPTAVAGTPLEDVQFGELPAVSMNNADNATSLAVADKAAAASMYGSDQQLRGAQASARRGKFTVGLPPQQASVYGPMTLQVDTMEEAIAAQQQMAQQYGGAVIGGGGIPGEQIVPPQTAHSDEALVNAWAARNKKQIMGPSVTRPDGTEWVKVRDKRTGVVSDQQITRRAQGQ